MVRGSSSVLTYRWDVPSQKWAFCQRLNPDFTDTRLAAYQALPRQLGLTGAGSNIRALYNDLSLNLSDIAARIYLPAPSSYEAPPTAPSLPFPTGATGFTADDWTAVCWQVYWELMWADAARTWFGLNATLITQTFLGNSLNLTTIGNYLNMTETDNTSVALNILSIIGNVGWALLGTTGIGAADASAMMGMLGIAASAAGTALSDDGTYSGAYSGLQNALTNGFNAAVTGNARNLNAVIGGTDDSGNYLPADYGLFKMFGENILSGTWKWTNSPTVFTVAQRSYALATLQVLFPYGAVLYNFLLGRGETLPIYSLGVGDDAYLRIASNKNGQYFADDTYNMLFNPVVSGAIFPLGQDMPSVYQFKNGWPWLQTYYVDNEVVRPPRKRSLRPDILVTPTLTRDASTGNVFVNVAVHNRGVADATNVQLTAVQLGGKNAPPGVTHERHFLRSNFTETFHVPFAGLAAGLKTTLTIRGRYKGGTFGIRLRVTVP
jgi:hypothetical protein